MSEIARSSAAIGEITQVMESIASQTNILALNAAVEAARAGNSGRGFTVLAQEIRSLAGRAGVASKEVRDLINNSNERISAGVRIMDDAGQAIDTIISSVSEVGDHLKAIDTATSEQAAALRDVNSAISVIDQGTRKNTAMVEETSESVVHMADEAGRLRKILSGFQFTS